ncbi:MAG: amidohydrolase, partial [Synergistaceae bacterium]|nr:amidohydrolase [Synergistaceae bacterium]
MEEVHALIKKEIDTIYSDVRTLQESIHREPELSNEEYKTREKVKVFLAGTKLEIKECVTCTGLICDLKIGEGLPTIAFRGDMDALSIDERADLPYKSTVKNAMHACGHDFHTATLAGLAKALSSISDRLKVNVRFIFQPAEENNPEGGAKRMIDEGALKDCSAIFGLHVWPELETGEVGLKAGPLFAASDRISIKITGKSAHAAKPEAGTDAIVIAGYLIVALQTTISRMISPFDEAVVTIGHMEGGVRHNILAEKAELQGTVRNTSSLVREKLKTQIKNIVEGTAKMFGGDGELDYSDGFPVLENNRELFEFVSKELTDLSSLEINGVGLNKSSMVAEDFSFYANEIPGFFMLLGCSAPGTTKDDVYPLHNSLFKADQNCIRTGLAAFIQVALNAGNMTI